MTDAFADRAAAHRFFAADCFNKAWELLDLNGRTPEQDRQLEALAHASVFHWMQRADVTPRNLSIGYWQLSRVYAALGNGAEALRHGRTCLAQSGDLAPFYLAYAHEALARAHALQSDSEASQFHREAAARLAEQVADDAGRMALLADLGSVDAMASGNPS